MKFLITLFFFFNLIVCQSFSYNTGNGFVFSNHSLKNKKKTVFLKNGLYVVHIYQNRSQEKKDKDDDESSFFRKDRFRIKKGNGIHFYNLGSTYERVLIEKHYVDGNFIITADNLRNEYINEIKKSSLSKKEKDDLIEEIDFTDFENRAEQLSYIVNIIKDHKAKDKLIKL